jgi:hypothetical protein
VSGASQLQLAQINDYLDKFNAAKYLPTGEELNTAGRVKHFILTLLDEWKKDHENLLENSQARRETAIDADHFTEAVRTLADGPALALSVDGASSERP